MNDSRHAAYDRVRERIEIARAAAGTPRVDLVAVSKTQPAEAIGRLARLGQRAFGENYVQEALRKQQQLADPSLEWHMIGPLQSNKCRMVAEHFDWLHSLDRLALIGPLGRHRPSTRQPLDVLVQVNIDDEASKSGCRPTEVRALARAVEEQAGLRLRGLMAIPAPGAGTRDAFRRMRMLFDSLRADHPAVDTLSMGMSGDFEEAIAEGATMVRIGTLLFGTRA